MTNHSKKRTLINLFLTMFLVWIPVNSLAGNLDSVKKSGKLRHLGIVYANFITQEKVGLDVELVQMFAKHLGVQYEFVETNWQDAIKDLTGKMVTPQGEDIRIDSEGHGIKGDILATGFTILPWREKIVDFGETTFPSGIWLIARADSALQPVQPTGKINEDISKVKQRIKGYSVLGLKGSCLDPNLYGIEESGATTELFPTDRNLDEMIPAVMARVTDTTLMDVPVALIALEQWPGKIKVVGPLSPEQGMAPAFSKESPKLQEEFVKFFKELKDSGQYRKLIDKYYPSLFIYYPNF